MPIPIIAQTTSRQDFIPLIKAHVVVMYLRGNIEIPPGLREGTCSKRFGDQRLIFPIQCQVLVHSRWVKFIFAQLDNGSKVWLGRGEVAPQKSVAPEMRYRSRARGKTRGGDHHDHEDNSCRVDSEPTTRSADKSTHSQLRHGQSSGGRGDPFRVAPAAPSKEPHGELKSQSRYTRYPHEQRREL